MINKLIQGATLTCLLFIAATPVLGSAVYSYTGNSFDDFSDPSSYTNDMFVTGTIELTERLVPGTWTEFDASNPFSLLISFSFNDGINTTTGEYDENWIFKTDLDGNIVEWKVSTHDGDHEIHTSYFTTYPYATQDYGVMYDSCSGCREDFGYTNRPGVWTQVVPIPAAAWLFGSGLIGLVFVARRKA